MKRKGMALLTATFMLMSLVAPVSAENIILDDGSSQQIADAINIFPEEELLLEDGIEDSEPDIPEAEEEILEEIPAEETVLEEIPETGEVLSGEMTEGVKEEALSSGAEEENVWQATVQKENNIELYAMNSSFAEKLKIPSSLKQNYQINILGGKSVTYRVVKGKSVKVSNKGFVKPATTKYLTGSGQYIEEYNFGTSVVEAVSDGKTYTYTFTVKDYANTYTDGIINEYISKNITGSMSNMEKLKKIAYFPCQYDYSPKHSSAAGMIVFGGGDCWASTDAILILCEKVGFTGRIREAANDPGAGSGHINALVQVDGKNYVVDAGFNQKAPRSYYIEEQKKEYSYTVNCDGKTITLKQYYGLDEKVVIPETIGGYKVTAIGDGCFSGREEMKQVVIPSSVKKIGQYAFYFTGMQTIKIPDGITEIGQNAFGYIIDYNGVNGSYGLVNNVEVIEIPSSVKKIGLNLSESVVLYHGTQQQWNAITHMEGYGAPDGKSLFCSNNGLAVSGTEVSLKAGETKTLKIYSAEGNITLTAGNKGIIETSTENEIMKDYFYRDGKRTPAKYAVKTLKIKGAGSGSTVLTVGNGRASRQIKVIVQGNISKCSVTLSQEKYSYNGAERKPSVTVTEQGRTLVNGKDYTVSYENNKYPGTGKAVIKGIGAYTGTTVKDFTIVKANQKIALSDITKRIDSKTYTLKAKITQGNKTGKFGYKSDNPSVATVTSWGRVTFTGVGTAKITATTRGSANYNSASKTITLTVLPAPTAITKLQNNGIGWLNIQWRANRNADGYQIQYGTSPDWKGAKTASIKDSGIRSYTRKDVFKGNTYYVRVRTYKMKDGVKYYSNWSGTKNVNINK